MPRYIDADALKYVIQQHDYPLSDKLNSIGNGMFTLGIFQAIDEQPTLSPDDARPVGKWIDCPATHIQDGAKYRMCSVCKEHIAVLGHDLNYCPNCGARMKGAEDETTDNP